MANSETSGLNQTEAVKYSTFKSSEEFPMLMFYGDFDANNSTETIIAIEKNGSYFTFASLDELSGQLVSLTKKKFPQYYKFAGRSLYEVFDKDLLNNGTILKVHTLESGYLENNNGVFSFVPFDRKLQVAPLTSFVKHNFTGDEKDEVLVGGNYYGVIPYHSRFDGFSGALILDKDTVLSGYEIGIDFTQKEIGKLNLFELNSKKYLLVTVNNNHAEIYEIKNSFRILNAQKRNNQ